MRRTLDRFDPMGHCRDMVDRQPSEGALEVADAFMAGSRRRLIDSDDPGVVALRAERMGLTYACPENPIYFDPRADEDDWSNAILNRDRSGELTGRWWFPLAVCGGIIALWGLLKWAGIK